MAEERSEKLKTLIFSGNKIQAIKFLREEDGLGLSEAKEQVEALEEQLRRKYPEKFQKPPASSPENKGCFFSVLTFSIIMLIFLYTIV